MHKQKRWAMIVDRCKTQGHAAVDELVELLEVSPATVRRDLQEMEDLNIISRYHGGARISQEQYNDPSMAVRIKQQPIQKRQIAHMAARLIRDNMMIYLDAGSTVHEMLQYINQKKITVVTPSISHLAELGQKNIHTIVIGGLLRWSSEVVSGRQALKQMKDLYFDIAFLGTNAIHRQLGFSTSNEMEADMKAMAIKRAKVAYVLADNTKFDQLSPCRFAGLSECIVITDDVKDFGNTELRYQLIGGGSRM